jgi:hypothetical protein
MLHIILKALTAFQSSFIPIGAKFPNPFSPGTSIAKILAG